LVERLESDGHIRRRPGQMGRVKKNAIEVLTRVTVPRINGEPLRFIAVSDLPGQNRPTISLGESPPHQGRTAPHAAKDRHGVQSCAPHFKKEK
jgi:hypothetical protein